MERSRVLKLVLLVMFLQTSNGIPVNDEEKRFAVKYLEEYHYLSPVKNGNHNLKDALRMFQEHSEIPDTGRLDVTTIKEMHKPRCGVPDIDEEANFNFGRVKRFSVSEYKWKNMQLTYKFYNYASNGGLTNAEQRSIVRRAFTAWEAIGPINFTDVTDNAAHSSSDITLSFFAGTHSNCTFPFDGAGGNLAHAFFPDEGIVHFDNDETFTDGVATGTNLFSVALHEIGHVLGLEHSQHSSAIMHQTYKSYHPNMTLTDEERHGIEYIYSGGTAQPDATKAPDQCVDKTATCSKYADQCNNGIFGSNMRTNCPHTCGQCGGQGVGTCKDIYANATCLMYQRLKLCHLSPIIQRKCPQSCNACT